MRTSAQPRREAAQVNGMNRPGSEAATISQSEASKCKAVHRAGARECHAHERRHNVPGPPIHRERERYREDGQRYGSALQQRVEKSSCQGGVDALDQLRARWQPARSRTRRKSEIQAGSDRDHRGRRRQDDAPYQSVRQTFVGWIASDSGKR